MNGALESSCDVYYYQVGLMIDMPIINETARMLGMGAPTGIDLPGEKRGLLIDSAIYERRNRRLHWRWARGLILNLAIGQGQLATPLQIAQIAAGVSNGSVWRPHLLRQLIDPRTGNVVGGPGNTLVRHLPFSPEHTQDVLMAMDSVVNGVQGTGHQASLPGIRVGGKTGSAENPHGLPHALFTCVAPLYSPEIAIGVVIENGNHGGSVAAPIAGKVLRRYFELTGKLKRDTAHKEIPHHE